MNRAHLVGVLVIVAAFATQGSAVVFTPTGNVDLGVLNDPAFVGTSIQGPAGTWTVTGGGSDWWDSAERAQVAYALMPAGEWRLETTISVVGDPLNDWFKAGLFLRNDVDTNVSGANPGAEREVNAAMVTTPPRRNMASFQYRPDNTNNWMGNGDIYSGQAPQKLAIQRQFISSGLYMYEGQVSFDGTTWQRAGKAAIANMVEQPYGGLMVTSHQNYWDDDADPATPEVPRSETAIFTNTTLSTSLVNLPDPAMRTVTAALPQGGTGLWGMREVYQNGDQGSLDSTVNSLNSGTGTIRDYTAPVANIYDSGSVPNARLGAAAKHKVVTDGLVGFGGVDNLAMAMNGKVKIPTDGWYTFNVNSDDGFELAVDGTVVMEANYGKGTSDVLGQRYLTAGVHNVRVLYWEGGGGSAVQVSAAQGFQTSFNSQFNLIGGAAIPAVPPRDYPTTPALANNWDVVALYNGGGDPGAAETTVRSYWAAPDKAAWLTANNRTAGTEIAGTVCYRDPDDGADNIHGFTTNPFPGQTNGVAENDFFVGARGQMTLAQAATMTFITYGDDGSIFRIAGTDGLWYGGGSTGGTYTDLSDGFRFDGWGQDAYRTIDLQANTDYNLELFWQEGGGGAYVALMARFGTWAEGSDWFLLGSAGQNVDFAGLPAIPAGLELVPEPATLTLLGLGLAGLAIRRRRHA